MKRPPRLVIIGRPNVGKSTLFNRLLGRRRALVHDLPGVTRDRLVEEAKWWVKGKQYAISLVDTGGLGGEKFAEEIALQVDTALAEADITLVLFDAQTGLTPDDIDVVQQVWKKGLDGRIPIIGVVNKVDAEVHEELIADFYASGLENLMTVSAEHNRGTADLEEAVIEMLGDRAVEVQEEALPEEDEQESADRESTDQDPEALTDWEEREYPEEDLDLEDKNPSTRIPRIAIVGKPNVGKSTLVNAILREDRMITSPIAGTTVDAVDSLVEINGEHFVLIDTAGIRRKSKTEQGVEVLSVVQARKALERCDVAILLLNGEEGIAEQDEKIGGLIEEVGCGVILGLNKWDTQRKTPEFTREIAAELVRKKMPFLRYAPLMFLSAKEKRGFEDLGNLVRDILNERKVKVTTREFTEWVRTQSGVHNPFGAKFYLCHQSGRHPPTFVCHVNDPKKVHFSLKRHLVNQMRERWGFMGNPVRLLFVKGKSK